MNILKCTSKLFVNCSIKTKYWATITMLAYSPVNSKNFCNKNKAILFKRILIILLNN